MRKYEKNEDFDNTIHAHMDNLVSGMSVAYALFEERLQRALDDVFDSAMAVATIDMTLERQPLNEEIV